MNQTVPLATEIKQDAKIFTTGAIYLINSVVAVTAGATVVTGLRSAGLLVTSDT